jgi:hypothetical protein
MDILEGMYGENAPSAFRMVGSGDKAHYTYPYIINGGMRELLTIFRAETEEITRRIASGNKQLLQFLEIKALN